MIYDVAVEPADRDRVKLIDYMLNDSAEAAAPKAPVDLYGMLRAALTGTLAE